MSISVSIDLLKTKSKFKAVDLTIRKEFISPGAWVLVTEVAFYRYT